MESHGNCCRSEVIKSGKEKHSPDGSGDSVKKGMIEKLKVRDPLEWNDESIDIITVCCAFHHFDHPQGFVSECKRVLKKNGTVYIADPNFGAFLRFFANKFWVLISKSGDVRIYSSKELKAFFYNSGFKAVQVYRKDKGLFLKAKK